MASPLTTSLRTHTTQQAAGLPDGEAVTLSGHCLGRLNDLEPHFNLADRYGKVRIHFGSDDPTEGRKAMTLSPEDVVQVVGVIAGEAEDQPGLRRVRVKTFQLLNAARGLPYNPREAGESGGIRDRYRYLELRNTLNQDRLQLRGLMSLGIRRHLQARGFMELESPALAPFNIDQTGVFPVAAGGFDCYGLSPTPQIYKQLLMIGGADRSFQFARCFRQQATYGPWHQPEFTALDLEMSFVAEEDIYREVDRLMGVVIASVGQEKGGAIPRMTWQEAMARYGTERPDLRFGLTIADITEVASRSHSAVIRTLLKGARGPGGSVRAIRITEAEGARMGPELLGALSQAVAGLTGVGVSWLKVEGPAQVSGPLARGFSEMLSEDLIAALGSKAGETLVMIISTHADVAAIAAGRVRTFLGERLGLISPGRFALAWVYQIPFFAYSPRGDCFVTNRHPFTQVAEGDMAHLSTLEAHRREGLPEVKAREGAPDGAGDEAPVGVGEAFDRFNHSYQDPDAHARRSLRSKGFELILNGVEIGTGSVRNHDAGLQRRVLALLGYDDETIEAHFGVLMRALQHGAPPHGGLSIGFDRLLAILLRAEGIRAVLPFPKDEFGRCPTTGAPMPVGAEHVQALLGVGPLDPLSAPTSEHAQVEDEGEEAPHLEAAFTFTPNPLYVGQSVTFVDLSQSLAPITDWLWSCPAIKWRSTEPRPRRSFSAPGEYVVTLTVMNADRLRASARVTLVVSRPAGMPRTLSP